MCELPGRPFFLLSRFSWPSTLPSDVGFFFYILQLNRKSRLKNNLCRMLGNIIACQPESWCHAGRGNASVLCASRLIEAIQRFCLPHCYGCAWRTQIHSAVDICKNACGACIHKDVISAEGNQSLPHEVLCTRLTRVPFPPLAALFLPSRNDWHEKVLWFTSPSPLNKSPVKCVFPSFYRIK